MIPAIVHSNAAVTLIGGGECTSADLYNALRVAPKCVAADGGAVLGLAEGVELEAVIGDFDSLSPQALAQIPLNRQHRITEQTSTDFEKALVRISAPLVLGVGFLGGRVDHQLAVFHTLLAVPERPCVLIGQHEIVCLAPPEITLPTKEGDTVSLFPMGGATGRSEGLAWPIEGLYLAPGQRVGTSNQATGPIRLWMDRPEMLLILPRRLMPELVALLMRQDAAQWPARAE